MPKTASTSASWSAATRLASLPPRALRRSWGWRPTAFSTRLATPASTGYIYRGELPDCPNGNDHRLTIWASYTAAHGLTVKGLESTQWPCDDLEYTYHVAPEHIGRLRAALGAIDDDDLVELLAQRYQDGTIIPSPWLDAWLKARGVAYSATEKRHPN